MSLASSMESLRSVDLSDLDMNNLGSWPAAVKVIAAILLMALMLGGGYYFYLSDLQANLCLLYTSDAADE